MERRASRNDEASGAGWNAGRECYAQSFAQIREQVLRRLVDARTSVDHTGGAAPLARHEFDSVLERMASYLAHGEIDRFRRFAARFTVIRLGEGYSPENLIHSVLAIGDAVVAVAKEQLSPTAETAELICEIARLNFIAARAVVDVLASELEGIRSSGASR